MNYQCIQCGEEFRSYNPNPKYCSVFCKAEHTSAGVDIGLLRTMYIAGKTQTEIAAFFGVSQKAIFTAMKRHGVKARKAAKRDQWGDKNSSWKGDDAGYQAMHRRLYSQFGKPRICGVCGTTDAKCYDYANLTGQYEDPDDYLPMCRSCHWKFDRTIENFKGGKNARANATS